jgi:PadR family transcriptional regulator, regulatory protein PadR
MTPLKSGTLDLALLSALEHQPRYGLDIMHHVNARSGGLFGLREGSLYPALHRLVKAGYIESEWQESTSGGAPRKYYQLTDSGHSALGAKKEEWNSLRGALDSLLLTGRLTGRLA